MPQVEPGSPEWWLRRLHAKIVARRPTIKRPRRRAAALRLYIDEVGIEHAELFLPDAVHLFRSPRPRESAGTIDPSAMTWLADTDDVPDGVMDNPFGVVPMVELPNRPR